MNFLYLISWVFPLTAILGISMGGAQTWLTFFLLWVVFPMADQLVGRSEIYPLIAPVQKYSLRYFFYEGVIYGYIGISLLFLVMVARFDFHTCSWLELFGIVSSMVIVNGLGLNTGHELEHRTRWMGKIMSGFYSFGNFYYAGHVVDHHNPLKTCREEDVSSAPKHQSFFRFLQRAVADARNKKSKRLLKNIPNISIIAGYIIDVVITALPIFLFAIFSGWLSSSIFFIAGLLGTILSATTFYMQHYGLRRFLPHKYNYLYTWDCDYVLTNFLFLNLPRHCHHHDEQYLPYWKLTTYKDSRRFAYGYMGMVLLFFYRKKFFSLMNERIQLYDDRHLHDQRKEANHKT